MAVERTRAWVDRAGGGGTKVVGEQRSAILRRSIRGGRSMRAKTLPHAQRAKLDVKAPSLCPLFVPVCVISHMYSIRFRMYVPSRLRQTRRRDDETTTTTAVTSKPRYNRESIPLSGPEISRALDFYHFSRVLLQVYYISYRVAPL